MSSAADRPDPGAAEHFDVAVLGTGLGGSVLGAILARNGARVVMIDRDSHPRFAIGESTIPETTGLFGILAGRYRVPELAHLANFQGIRRHVSAACGIKRNFSFVYHRPGEEQRPRETSQFPTWAPPFGPDVHLFRQDSDAFLLAVAVRHGARVLQRTSVERIEAGETAVELATEGGRVLRASMLVDASGYGSPVGRAFGLREEPTSLRTRSRCLFTHMIDVEPFDRSGPSRREHGLPSPFHQGTLHHLFDGGWIWVIPFDNHPSSTNPLVSVGACLDPERFPRRDDPEEEFRELISRFPAVERQFARAKAVRDWVSTGRIQYSSRRVSGDRLFVLPHAAGFVDPLFSNGLALTLATINPLGERILRAIRDDDFSAGRFADLDRGFHRNLDYYDRLVAGSYVAFRDFGLWNAWHRVWMLGSLYGISGQHEVYSRWRRSGDPAELERFEEAPYRGTQAIDLPEYRELFDAAAAEVDAVAEERSTPQEATAAIYRLLEDSPLPPAPWKLTDPDRRCPGTFTLVPLVRLLLWGRFRSPDAVRRTYFRTGSSGGLLGALWSDQADEARHAGRLGLGLVRDSLFSWNRDWHAGASEPAVWH